MRHPAVKPLGLAVPWFVSFVKAFISVNVIASQLSYIQVPLNV
jgi:hypothetical protein